ncbi:MULTISPECIES: nuclease-related domain-containing protein [unclassified Pseudoalteromonas]|uniref:nuclease-related domain-containing protein n=1 Tax=unclassified Pseudoalteromonas TaxID=194690 RepID=UPI002096CE27|nr:nuclease-related domain-containing protein [Pseudoalteromonas sp. XMcav2-N]MCO7190464.1 NERD domain-containing protein [Pseudoalteromonas sp. XMcav2-N]
MNRWIWACLWVISSGVSGATTMPDNAVQPVAEQVTGFTALNLIALCFCVYLLWALGRYLYLQQRHSDKEQCAKQKWQVYQNLASSLDAKNYTILSRHLYPNQLEALSLDCVVLSPFGVFVIVVIDQKGLIAVETDSQVWPCRYKNKTHYLPNPLSAAAQRASTLASVFNTPFGVRWIAVFPDEAEFSPTRPADCCTVSEVALDILRYTRCQFSHEQTRLFEQAVLAYGDHHKRLSA